MIPLYYRKLDNLLRPDDRFREPPSWRKKFKKEWRRCATTALSDPDDTPYNTDPTLWVCGCKSFVLSRFLLCKHLVQSVEAVPATFFQEVSRSRTTPFWRHPDLKPRADAVPVRPSIQPTLAPEASRAATTPPADDDDDDSDDDDDTAPALGSRQPFHERMGVIIDTLSSFTDGLRFQVQFADIRFLRDVEREGARLMRLAIDCLELERTTNRTDTPRPNMWQGRNSNTMYYRTRPAQRDRT